MTVWTPEMVEGAVQTIADLIATEYNVALDQTYEYYQAIDPVHAINLPKIEAGSIYVSEEIDPLQCPAVFILAATTEINLQMREPFVQTHDILVDILAEDVGAELLTRKVWRYARTMYGLLKDRRVKTIHGNGQVIILVRSLDYSPIYSRGRIRDQTNQRKFRKDASLRLRVKHDE